MRLSRRVYARQVTKAQLDKLFARLVKNRDGWKCRLCGSGEAPQCAHLFSRRYLNTRWDLENAWTLCRRCHYRNTLRPAEWTALLEKTLGRENHEILRARAFTVAKVDLELVRLSLTRKDLQQAREEHA